MGFEDRPGNRPIGSKPPQTPLPPSYKIGKITAKHFEIFLKITKTPMMPLIIGR